MKTGCRQILIVEDEPDARETLKDLLEMEGFAAAGAANGKEAFAWLAEHGPPCMILLDLMMPVMNGWQFLELLQAQRKDVHEGSKVVVVSAAADVGLNLQHLGCDLMKKPIDLERLYTLVRAHC